MIRRVKRFNAPALGSPSIFSFFFWGGGGASWGSFGASWAPKLAQVGSQRRLGRGLGSKKRFFKSTTFFPGKTTHSGLPEPPKTGQDRPKTGPRSSRDALENIFFIMLLFGVDFGAFGGRFGVSLRCLWGLFWRPLARKIGAKFDQKIVDNKNRPKMTPRESKSPPGTPLRPPQDPPRAPQDPPRSTLGAPKLAKY